MLGMAIVKVIAANVETEVKRSKDLTDKAEKWANGLAFLRDMD